MFSKLFSFLKKLVNKIVSLLKKLWKALAPILAIAFICFMVAVGAGILAAGFLGTLGTALGFWGSLAVGIGGAMLIHPETAKKVVDGIVKVASKVAEVAGGVAAGVAGGLFSGLFSSGFGKGILLLGAGYVGYKVYSNRDTSKSKAKPALVSGPTGGTSNGLQPV